MELSYEKALRQRCPSPNFDLDEPIREPEDLEALLAEQPLKAAVVEGESWDGTAEQSIAKWRICRCVEGRM